MKSTLQLPPSLPTGSFQATVQQGDPDSSSSSESLGHEDRDSSLVAAICGSGILLRGVGESARRISEDMQKDSLPLHSAQSGRNP